MMAPFYCCGTSPPHPNTNGDTEQQSPSQGGIIVEGDLE